MAKAKTAEKATKITAPSVLAFERKLSPSDGYMYATNWSDNHDNEMVPLALSEATVLGTVSNYQKPTADKDPAKLNAKVSVANIQTIDQCFLPEDMDTLVIKFNMAIFGNVGVPHACNEPKFADVLAENVDKYIKSTGMKELAYRYAYNLASAHFLWRNRLSAENIAVVIETGDLKLTVDAFDYPLNSFEHKAELEPLAAKIAETLAGKDTLLKISVKAYAQIGCGLPVYPSEEFVANKEADDKSKVLYQNGGVAAMHSQKIGNAIRTIDTWYDDFGTDKGVGPLAVEPFSSVPTRATAFRLPNSKRDFYYLFYDKFTAGEELPEDDAHFIMANLVRGGVFGKENKKK